MAWLGSAERACTVKADMKSHILLQQNLIPGDIQVLRFCKLAVQPASANSTKPWLWLLALAVAVLPQTGLGTQAE